MSLPPERGAPPRGHGGYTIIELLTVVMIVAILAAIAVPAYMYYRNKAIGVEAKGLLASIRKLELIYYATNDAYTDDLNLLGFTLDGTSRYTFAIPSAGSKGFSATATANLDMDAKLDVWAIDQSGEFSHLSTD